MKRPPLASVLSAPQRLDRYNQPRLRLCQSQSAAVQPVQRSAEYQQDWAWTDAGRPGLCGIDSPGVKISEMGSMVSAEPSGYSASPAEVTASGAFYVDWRAVQRGAMDNQPAAPRVPTSWRTLNLSAAGDRRHAG